MRVFSLTAYLKTKEKPQKGFLTRGNKIPHQWLFSKCLCTGSEFKFNERRPYSLLTAGELQITRLFFETIEYLGSNLILHCPYGYQLAFTAQGIMYPTSQSSQTWCYRTFHHVLPKANEVAPALSPPFSVQSPHLNALLDKVTVLTKLAQNVVRILLFGP